MSVKRLYRLVEVIGQPAKVKNGQVVKPAIKGVFPVSRAAWYRGMLKGIYPMPVQLTPRTLAWREEDLEKLVAEVSGKTAEKL
jgi:predicted DNA-binding transcriptional regulator AlpA